CVPARTAAPPSPCGWRDLRSSPTASGWVTCASSGSAASASSPTAGRSPGSAPGRCEDGGAPEDPMTRPGDGANPEQPSVPPGEAAPSDWTRLIAVRHGETEWNAEA